MSLYNGPPRPGARGGRAEFSWDNVKSDRDREYYLGHSVKASVGRWQKGKDLTWYAKDKGDMGVSQEELEAVKAREREMMAEALGLKPKSPPSTLKQPSLEKHEVERLLKGGAEQQEAAAGAAGSAEEAERMEGLGFNSGAGVAVREAVHEVLPGTVMGSRPAAGAGKLLTVEQLAALEKASAAADAAGKHTHKKRRRKERSSRDKDRSSSKKHKKEKSKKHKKEKRQKHKHTSRSRSRSPNTSSSSEDVRERQHRQQPQQQELQRGRFGSSHEQDRYHAAAGAGKDRLSAEERPPLRRGDPRDDPRVHEHTDWQQPQQPYKSHRPDHDRHQQPERHHLSRAEVSEGNGRLNSGRGAAQERDRDDKYSRERSRERSRGRDRDGSRDPGPGYSRGHGKDADTGYGRGYAAAGRGERGGHGDRHRSRAHSSRGESRSRSRSRGRSRSPAREHRRRH